MIFKKKIFKPGIIGLAVLLALSGVLYLTVFNKSKAASGGGQLRTANVVKGVLSNSIEGSGPIASSTRKEISPKAVSTVEKIYFKEGDQVRKGDLMFELDDTDALMEIENTKNNIEQTQLTLDNNQKSVDELSVKAPYDGLVTELTAKEGDSVNGPILRITDTSGMKLTVPFSTAGISGLYAGKKVTVNLQELIQSVEGTVTYVGKKPYTTAAGGQLYNVEIEIKNPGSLTEGMTANAETEAGGVTVTSAREGTLSYINSKVIRGSSGGTVKRVNVMDNEYVSAGDILVEIENDNLQLNLSSTELKLKNLRQQLAIQEEQLAYYKLTAPCNGTITTQNVTVGDTVSAGKVLAAVADMDSLEFQVSIDELDISKIELGQDVKITADALPETTDKPLSGKVVKISMEGTGSNGVTTYPVTISVDKNEKLKAGMNVNGEIITSMKENVLMVPIEAVTKMNGKSFVLVAGNNKSGQNNSGNAPNRKITAKNKNYANAARVAVETGISNDTFIEIKSGLTEGQTVILPAVSSNTGANKSPSLQQIKQQQAGFGGNMIIRAGKPD